MKKILLYILFMLVIIKVNGQTYYKLDYSGNASGNNIQMEVDHIFSATNIKRLEFRIYEPLSYAYDNLHNSQTIQNFSVHPAPDITYSDGNRKTYIYDDINTPNFTFRKTYNATTNVNLGLGFYSHDTYPVTSVPAEYLMATDSIQADNVNIVMLAQQLTSNLSENRIHDAVTEIAKYIVSYISGREEQKDQDAVSVLNKGSGNCRGQTNLMVAMLRSLGIPARNVGGLLLNEPFLLPVMPGNNPITRGASGPGRHAVYEVYYPSLGKWVQGEPQGYVHFNHQNFIKTSYPPDNINAFELLYQATGELTRLTNIKSTFGSTTNNYKYEDYEVFTGPPTTEGNLLISVYNNDIGTGVGDYIVIQDPPENAPFPANTYDFYLDDELSFYFHFYSYSGSTYYTECDWTIDLYHSEGEFELLSGNSLEIWQPMTPYSIPDFEWAKWPDSDEIVGKVKALCLLNDGDFVYDDHAIRLKNECKPYFITDQILSYNSIFNECHLVLRNVEIRKRRRTSPSITINAEKAVLEDNVAVHSDSKLQINANYLQIDKNFEVQLGGELIIE